MESGLMKKEEVFKKNHGKIMSLVHKYKNVIHDYDVEDLYQEVLTHLDLKLNDYDEEKASIDTFVYMVAKNKLYNMANNRHNHKDALVNEITMEKLMEKGREDLVLADKVALEVAFDLLKSHNQAEMIFDLIKGDTQKMVSKKYDVSQQYVSRIFNEFIQSVKDEL